MRRDTASQESGIAPTAQKVSTSGILKFVDELLNLKAKNQGTLESIYDHLHGSGPSAGATGCTERDASDRSNRGFLVELLAKLSQLHEAELRLSSTLDNTLAGLG